MFSIKKCLSCIAIVFFATIPFFTAAQPLTSASSVNPQSYGQTHSYSVLMRGNGEAVVWATVKITNGANTPLSQLTLKTGSISTRLIEVWQESEIVSASQPARCYRANMPQESVVAANTAECRAYGQDFIYYSSFPGKREYRYSKLPVQLSGKTATLTLSQQIDQNKEGTVIISYRGFGAADKGLFGRMKFDFQTLESTDRIRSVNVVINADTELYIKGDKAEVSYTEEAPLIFSSQTIGESGSIIPAAGVAPSSDSVSYRIGREKTATSITKSTSDLLAGDVFHVRGLYASSWFGIYWTKIVVLVIVIAVVVMAIIFSLRFWRARHDSIHRITEKSLSSISDSSEGSHSWRNAVTIGFINAVGTIIIAFATPYVWSIVDNVIYFSGSMSLAFIIIFPLAGILLYGAMLFAPAIYFGNKYGRDYGFIVFGSHLGSLFLLAFIYVLVIYILFGGTGRFGGI